MNEMKVMKSGRESIQEKGGHFVLRYNILDLIISII
jgi:hypothetical protein